MGRRNSSRTIAQQNLAGGIWKLGIRREMRDWETERLGMFQKSGIFLFLIFQRLGSLSLLELQSGRHDVVEGHFLGQKAKSQLNPIG